MPAIKVMTRRGEKFIESENILFATKASNDYVLIHHVDGVDKRECQLLGLERTLGEGFTKINNQTLVNLEQCDLLKRGPRLLYIEGREFKVSSTYYGRVRNWMVKEGRV